MGYYDHIIDLEVEVTVPVRLRIGIEPGNDAWDILDVKHRPVLRALAADQCAVEIDEAVADEIERIREEDPDGEDQS